MTPYRKSGKNDGNDAEATCEAVARPSMRFVPVTSLEHLALLALHRVRQGFVVESLGWARCGLIDCCQYFNKPRSQPASSGEMLPSES